MADLANFPNVLANGDIPDADLLMADLQHLRTYVNSALDADNITAGTLDPARIADASLPASVLVGGAGSDQRGKSIIATAGTTTSTSFAALNNGPDQVASLVVPTDGLLKISFSALWKATASAQAAIFIGSNQLSVSVAGVTAPQVQAGRMTTQANLIPLTSFGLGLASTTAGSGSDATLVTTGQVLGMAPTVGSLHYILNNATTVTAGGTVSTGFAAGGECVIRGLPAATYTVAVKFKAESAGTVTVQNRELRAKIEG